MSFCVQSFSNDKNATILFQKIPKTSSQDDKKWINLRLICTLPLDPAALLKSHRMLAGSTGQQLSLLDFHFIISFLSTVSEFR